MRLNKDNLTNALNAPWHSLQPFFLYGQVEENQISITDPSDAVNGVKREPKAFSYDFAYDWTSSQEGVHLDLGSPIVTKALQGYNGTKQSKHDAIKRFAR